MESYINKKIGKDISLARSILEDLESHIGKISESDVTVCQKLLNTTDIRYFLSQEFVEHIEMAIQTNVNHLVKNTEAKLQTLRKFTKLEAQEEEK